VQKKELKLVFLTVGREEDRFRAEDGRYVADLQLKKRNLVCPNFYPDKNIMFYTIIDGASITLPR
jgi:hypothetical protein